MSPTPNTIHGDFLQRTYCYPMSSTPCKLIKQGHKHSFGEKGGGREPYTLVDFLQRGAIQLSKYYNKIFYWENDKPTNTSTISK